ncbi:UNVERIFIED_CONTAM: hypothetical protein FKN15_072281 [Acipenser sinensis]
MANYYFYPCSPLQPPGRPPKCVFANPSFFALRIHSEATRPIVPEDNTNLNGSTADPQAPYQPQGSLIVWQWNITTPPSPGITRTCCTSDRLSIPSIAGQQTAAPTRVTITCPTATFTRETTCTGSTRDSTSVDGARNPTGLNVETLVVADRKMVEKHGKENITTYVLTVMNMVSSLFKDGTIGKDINIVVVSLLLLEQDPVGLSISHHADLSLNSFCQWQSGLIGKNGKRHDHAVLLTGLDICSWKNEPCDTLGFAPISGMCSKYRSCTINEDTGLGLAFTIAHESGHNFGMIHDGEGNVCKKAEGNIMSPTLAGNNGVFSWSACSRQYLNRFLSTAQASCLVDEPKQVGQYRYPDKLPGQLYDADTQCKWQFGSKAKLCNLDFVKDICKSLWCHRTGNRCETKFMPAAEGTICGQNMWCRRGLCVKLGDHGPKAVHGQWSQWSEWSECSRTCGRGVTYRERHCNSPKPQYGGEFCQGSTRLYQLCNINACQPNSVDFRAQQCAEYNSKPFRGWYYKWKPYTKVEVEDICKLYCIAEDFEFFFAMSSKVKDGTSCSDDMHNVCIDGICEPVGCDQVLGSKAALDACGVCEGDNSTCTFFKGQYLQQHRANEYYSVVTIPAGVRSIRVHEMEISTSYLAVRSLKKKYYLTGDWTVDWPGQFPFAGTVFDYQRSFNRPESLYAAGPTNETLVFEVNSQETKSQGYSWFEKKYYLTGDWTVDWPGQFPFAGTVFDYQRSFNRPESLYAAEYYSVVTIPAGVRSIRVHEMEISTSYLAVRSLKKKYYLTGDWTVDWPGQFPFAGTVFDYQRSFNRPESLYAAGPTNETLVFEILLQGKNPGIAWEYTLPKSLNDSKTTAKKHNYTWVAVRSDCSASCAGGQMSIKAVCLQDHYTQVNSSFCNPRTRPTIGTNVCNTQPCPAFWSAGEWSTCSKSCGLGQQSRQIQCLRKVAFKREEVVAHSQCPVMTPAQGQPCNNKACLPEWSAGAWSECSKTCGRGLKKRSVYCSSTNLSNKPSILPDSMCSRDQKPKAQETCVLRRCPKNDRLEWVTSAWSECSTSCGPGVQKRELKCSEKDDHGKYIEFPQRRCRNLQKPIVELEQACNKGSCSGPRPPPERTISMVVSGWYSSPWQQCTVSCGGGVQTRSVQCLRQGRPSDDPSCIDFFSWCHLVLQHGVCNHKFYGQQCCKSCTRKMR